MSTNKVFLFLACSMLFACNFENLNRSSNDDPIPGIGPIDSSRFVILLTSPSNNATDIDGGTRFSVVLDTSTPYLSENDAFKYVQDLNQYVSFGQYELEILEYKVSASNIRIDFGFANSPILEEGSYTLKFIHPSDGDETSYNFRKESRLHVQGVRIEKIQNSSDEYVATILMSEPVVIEDESQICVNNECLASHYVGSTGLAFNITIQANPDNQTTLSIDKSVRSAVTDENISVLSWQLNDVNYKRIGSDSSFIFIDYINGFNEFNCDIDLYCWGSF